MPDADLLAAYGVLCSWLLLLQLKFSSATTSVLVSFACDSPLRHVKDFASNTHNRRGWKKLEKKLLIMNEICIPEKLIVSSRSVVTVV